MGDFYFYGTWKDTWALLEAITSQERFEFIVDMWYSEAKPIRFKTLTNELRSIIEKQPRLYLWSEEYSRFPPYFSTPTSNGLMRIDLTRSGPALDLSLPGVVTMGKQVGLTLGRLGYQPRQVHPRTRETFGPSSALKAA